MIDPANVKTHIADSCAEMLAEARENPNSSPLSADLGGIALLPALFTVGMMDPLRDTMIFTSSKWLTAGGATVVEVHLEASNVNSTFLEDQRPFAKQVFIDVKQVLVSKTP